MTKHIGNLVRDICDDGLVRLQFNKRTDSNYLIVLVDKNCL